MILGFSIAQVALLLGISLLCGAIGAGIVLISRCRIRKKQSLKNAASFEERTGWQKTSRDEQLYNGR